MPERIQKPRKMKKNDPQKRLEKLKKEEAEVKADIRFLKNVILQVNTSLQKQQEEGELNDIEKELDRA